MASAAEASTSDVYSDYVCVDCKDGSCYVCHMNKLALERGVVQMTKEELREEKREERAVASIQRTLDLVNWKLTQLKGRKEDPKNWQPTLEEVGRARKVLPPADRLDTYYVSYE